ncbi:MAG TPA: 16S rRNA (uracil(1498)-N(3))-methyltransferase [Gammaproteobacteria bacterium]|nr:16S rRNA (uracil(1498)-N(3))-methyltransferase [Gammaproteobacteria bacterium]
MPISRIFQATFLALHEQIHLDEKASHHVARVLRAKIGDQLILFNGQGGEYLSVIEHINKKGVDLAIIEFISREAESPVDLCFAQGIARGNKMDFIVQKSVELGVNKIVPLMTERCHIKRNTLQEKKRLIHWQSVAISACEQCGRNRLPMITLPMMLEEWVPQAKANYRFVLSPHHSNSTNSKNVNARQRSIILLIGAEGGLTDNEVKLAIRYQFSPLHLGPRILRTETAGLAAISIIQACWGDMKTFSTINKV